MYNVKIFNERSEIIYINVHVSKKFFFYQYFTKQFVHVLDLVFLRMYAKKQKKNKNKIQNIKSSFFFFFFDGMLKCDECMFEYTSSNLYSEFQQLNGYRLIPPAMVLHPKLVFLSSTDCMCNNYNIFIHKYTSTAFTGT